MELNKIATPTTQRIDYLYINKYIIIGLYVIVVFYYNPNDQGGRPVSYNINKFSRVLYE